MHRSSGSPRGRWHAAPLRPRPPLPRPPHDTPPDAMGSSAGFSAAILTYEWVIGTVIVAPAVTDVAVKIDFLVAVTSVNVPAAALLPPIATPSIAPLLMSTFVMA